MTSKLLLQKKNAIVAKWIESIIKTYPVETADFLHLQKDRFANPVGHIISANAEKLFDEIMQDFDTVKIKKLLYDIIRLRAVQNFFPSQAVGFIFSLKQAIYSELDDIKVEESSEELMTIEYRIDQTALIAFDLYSDAREKVYQIRIKEVKSQMQHDLVMESESESNLPK